VSVCVFIPVGGIERFIVLDAVEVIVERQKVDNDLRQRLQGSESRVRQLKASLACHSTEEDIVTSMLTLLEDPDRGAWPWSSGERIGGGSS
jgi:hypothetical protein